MKIIYGETSFLFTGDAEREEEQQILDKGYDLSATVLKVGHHGSRNSTTYPFLREIMPEYAIISVGKDNTYGHPTEDVLSRLGDAGAKSLQDGYSRRYNCCKRRSYRNYNTNQNADADTLSAQRDVTTPKPKASANAVGYIGNSKTKNFICRHVKLSRQNITECILIPVTMQYKQGIPLAATVTHNFKFGGLYMLYWISFIILFVSSLAVLFCLFTYVEK